MHDLARLYLSVDRQADARDILNRSWNDADFSQYYGWNSGYAEYARISHGSQVASQLVEAGFPVDRIASVAGRAARDPLLPDDTASPRNRRVSILLLKRDILCLYWIW